MGNTERIVTQKDEEAAVLRVLESIRRLFFLMPAAGSSSEAVKRSSGSQQATRDEGGTCGERRAKATRGGGEGLVCVVQSGEDETERLERREMTAVTSPVERIKIEAEPRPPRPFESIDDRSAGRVFYSMSIHRAAAVEAQCDSSTS